MSCTCDGQPEACDECKRRYPEQWSCDRHGHFLGGHIPCPDCTTEQERDAAIVAQAKAEGRREALEEAAKVAEGWAHDDDPFANRLRTRARAAAIRALADKD